MKVDNGGSTQLSVAQALKAKPEKSQNPAEIEAESEILQSVDNGDLTEKMPGVIRLLQEGHFKGVADVRLRINFHEEIQAIEDQAGNAAASENFEEFNQSVQDQITELCSNGLLEENQTAAMETFITNLQNAQTDFLEDPNSSVQALIENLQNDFNLLIDLLNPPSGASEQEPETSTGDASLEEQIQETPEVETLPETTSAEEAAAEDTDSQPVEPQLITDESTEEQGTLQQLIQSFQETIQTFIDKLQSDLTSGTSVLPPISEPSGNGKAFAKFMAIYEEMLNSGSGETDQPVLLDAEEIIASEENLLTSEIIEA